MLVNDISEHSGIILYNDKNQRVIMKKTIGLVTLLLATSAAHANAQQDFNEDLTPKYKGFYLGAGVGNTTFDSDDDDVSNADTDGQTVKILAGYQFSKVFALEGQYTKYSEIGNSSNNYTWSPTSLSLSANLGYSFDNGLRPFGIIGVSALDLDESVKVLEDDSSGAVRFGFGLEYAPVQLKGLSARVGYEVDFFSIETVGFGSSITNDYTLESFYVSASYKF